MGLRAFPLRSKVLLCYVGTLAGLENYSCQENMTPSAEPRSEGLSQTIVPADGLFATIESTDDGDRHEQSWVAYPNTGAFGEQDTCPLARKHTGSGLLGVGNEALHSPSQVFRHNYHRDHQTQAELRQHAPYHKSTLELEKEIASCCNDEMVGARQRFELEARLVRRIEDRSMQPAGDLSLSSVAVRRRRDYIGAEVSGMGDL